MEIKKTLIIFSFSKIILKGIGQIMLQANSITGFLFLIGIFYGSVEMGIAAILATLSGTLTAYLFQFDKDKIAEGLYGFSAALVGVAVVLFFVSSPLNWLLVTLGGSLAALLQHFFISRKITVFTLPFVFVTWLLFFCIKWFSPEMIGASSLFEFVEFDYLNIGFRGFSQVIFQGEIFSGILFFIAVFISSPIAALYAFFASVLGGILAAYFHFPINEVAFGLWGFNVVLTSIVFAGTKIGDGIWVLSAVFLSTFISYLFMELPIYQLTFPFVVTSMFLLFIKKGVLK